MTTFSQQTLTRWQHNPISFIQQCLMDVQPLLAGIIISIRKPT